jgi:23S rRNA pseudouridine2605 synthase
VKERVQKLLSRAGVASRREAERLLAAGRIRVNGRVVTEPGTQVEPTDRVEVDGAPIRCSGHSTYLLMYKPRGCVTTMSDPQGRPTVADFLPRKTPRLFPVGRLDYDSEGLLLFTNDGELAQALMRPGSSVPKTYQVKVRGRPDPEALERLRQPFRIGGRLTRPARVEIQLQRRHTVLTITLTEGRKNQVREMCHKIQHPVMRLRRVGYGPLRDPFLRPGQTRELRAAEVEALRGAVGSPAMGRVRRGTGRRGPPRAGGARRRRQMPGSLDSPAFDV